MTARKPRRRRYLIVFPLSAFLGAGILAGVGVAQEPPPQPAADEVAFTMLGRGYGMVLGYPADEVPGGGDEEEEPEDPLPDQTCPAGERGVPSDVQARLDKLADTADKDTTNVQDNNVPSPRGQPIKFNFGLADTSLRSDPGSHAIASFFYVDLGGGQDPATSTEADGYASGHTRKQERCSQPFSSRQGNAEQVHVISQATDGPYAYAFNQTQNPRVPVGASLRESITVSEMDASSDTVRGKAISIAEGVTVGDVHAEEVASVVEYVTDGTEGGTTVKAFTDVSGLTVAGEPQRVSPGAPPITVNNVLLGIATPEVRKNSDGRLEVTAGGLYIGGEFSNPTGLQAKQAVFVGGVWYEATAGAATPMTDDPLIDDEVASPSLPAGEPLEDFGGGAAAVPPETPSGPAPSAAGAPETQTQPVVAAENTRLGVYRAPVQFGASLMVLIGIIGTMFAAAYIWARHRYPEIRAALATPLFGWLDYVYRAFMRG
ncbi:MAG: hypothetical protein GEU86_14070 [Actinophytocola sp.]|nr:hypothetical protein [Actinophytocola sp.]